PRCSSTCAPARARPSLPTRRSSDLAVRRRPPAARRHAHDRSEGPTVTKKPLTRAPETKRPGAVRTAVVERRLEALHTTLRLVLRSEEHTSELQSRENLVCRLLLEKK